MRGEVWAVAGSGFASKPRPAVVVQSDDALGFDSVMVCLLTTDGSIGGPTRAPLSPGGGNGLDRRCYAMADKVLAVRRSSLGERVGELSPGDMGRVDAALRAVLGL